MQRLWNVPAYRAICIVVLLSTAAALLGRYGLMENESLGTTCKDTGDSSLCGIWTWLPQIFVNNRLGIVALVAAVAALVLGRRELAWVGLALGTMGLVLYCFEFSAVALVASLVCLLRSPAAQASPGH